MLPLPFLASSISISIHIRSTLPLLLNLLCSASLTRYTPLSSIPHFAPYPTVASHTTFILKIAALTQLASRMALPPKDLADHLIECYWTYVHPHLPIVHKPTFMRQYRNPDPEKRPPAVLLHAMFAIASRFTDHAEIIVNQHRPEDFGDVYFECAKQLVDMEYELPRQSSIQALLLMVSYRFTSPKSGGRVWVMLGMATRMAQDLGMHRSSARWHLPPLETEIRKRLWWVCYIMDRWTSAAMGRPPAIEDSDCDVDYPSSLEQDWVDLDGNTSSPHQSSEKSKEEFALLYFVETIKLSQILGQILRRIYGANSRSHGPLQVSSTVAKLDTMLTKWLLALPEDLKYDHQTTSSNPAEVGRWVVTIHSAYYAVLILLHRPYMVPTSLTNSNLSKSMPSLNIAVSAANSITHLLGKLEEDDYLGYVWNFSTYEALTSSLIHLTNSASIDLRLQTQARKNLVKNISYMKKMGKRWFNAAKFSSVLEDLMCAHLNFDSYKPEGRSLEPIIITKVGDVNSIYPIILRDQHHPSGGSLLYAPKFAGVPQTPSSNTTTPESSPSVSVVHNPDINDVRQDANVPDLSTAPTSAGSSPTSASAADPRPMKKGRKTTSQRNSLLFQSTISSSALPGSSSSNINNISASSATLPDQSMFTFSSLSTPGMFAEGQAFMEYDQMIAHQQLQLQQHSQEQELQEKRQAFTATPLLSSPFALQGSKNGQQPPLPAGPLLRHPPQSTQQQQQPQSSGQQRMSLQQQPMQVSGQPQPGNYVDLGTSDYNAGVSALDAAATLDFVNGSDGGARDGVGFQGSAMINSRIPSSSMTTSTASIVGGSTSNSAIPSGLEDYSHLTLFPQQDFGMQDADANMMAAVPNPFSGIPNTIDWDEWNQYIASAGLQNFK
ncbi:fungal-specific transcription factor domain-containing protein [Dissophora ornata]|nr:fungal-specific transcription factor domain-containing protein [Dissophora ornata]